MADFGISVAAKLIEVIGSEIIKEICDLWGYKSHLEELRKTILTIKNVLLDADAKRELTIEQLGYIRELKAAVYDADDLFDQFLTLAELNQIDGNKAGKSITYKLRRFFSSSSNKLGQAYNMSRKVKDIKKKLDVIVDDHIKFGLSVDYKPICRRTEETCSYVDANDIIGRDEDKEKIINRLLDPEGKDEFRLVTIVGVGGLGKTALAQLVYNDDKIREQFQALRLWVCVSDQEGKEFDVKEILCKIIETLTGNKVDSSCTMELVAKQFEEQLKGKKYMLVLDDMWNEDRKKWVDLERFLKWGHVGSRILVTTRSNITTSVIGDKHALILEGLSKEESWRLFEMSAFIEGHEDENRHELNNIGKKIIKKCYCNPLAIKVVGSLLYGQSINKWRLFAESGLDRIDVGGDKIMYILKLSYHNLEPSLKSCFSYCALFPKDFRIDKEMLISLWMAQGYVMPLYGEKNIEDVAEEYFLVLLRRCFFQDVIKDEYGEVKWVKMHDLMHDVAQDVGRDEICVVNSSAQEDQLARLGDKIRHVCYVGDDECRNKSLSRSKIRSFIYWERKTPLIDISNWVCLRVLYLQTCIDRSFLMSIDKLLLLRYLDLSCNKDLQALPNSITKLHNLQTLLLSGCSNLREFPKEFCKLVKLRHLNLNGCNALTHMPLAMDKLTNLRLLPLFVAGCEISTATQSDGELKSLKVLTKIKRDIEILICSNFDYNVEKVVGIGEGYLSKMEHLNGVTIRFDSSRECDNHETLLGNMEPHLNLKSFALYGYKGRTIPRWRSVEDNWDISLPNLTHIHLQNCHRLIEIPALSRLRHLRSLKLINLRKLEYMENSSEIGSRRSDPEAIIFFPSLEFLVIDKLRKLKGWWKREVLVFDADHLLRTEFQFRHLSTLKIQLCPNLTSFPPCPSLETLDLCFNNKSLEIIVNPSPTDGPDLVKLRNFRTENVSYLKSLPGGCISLLLIDGDYELRKLSEFGGDVFKTHATSLKHLSIVRCCNLRSLSEIRGLEHLTALERLNFCNNEQFGVEDDDDDDEPWKSFQHSLCNLSFTRLPNMTSLPKAMQHLKSLKQLGLDGCVNMKALPGWISCLSSLRTLSILYCHALGSLPEEMRDLTSLHTLVIRGCSELIERCKEPDGQGRSYTGGRQWPGPPCRKCNPLYF